MRPNEKVRKSVKSGPRVLVDILGNIKRIINGSYSFSETACDFHDLCVLQQNTELRVIYK
jgi:hypothetical protein